MTTADVGAMISTARFEFLESVLEAAQNHGATIDVGGQRWKHPYLEHGAYFSPTVVGEVDPKSHLAQAESMFGCLSIRNATEHTIAVFAPIAPIIRYDNLDEAIDIANNTKYGLGASVFGPDQEKCVEKVAKHLHCGMVSINDFGVFYVSTFCLVGSI